MRPRKLEISAWGPYKEVVKIDFDEVGKDNIFLITGPTGAGKTTIFDAVSFALFGIVSGENRGKDRLRSDFAKGDIETYVTLTFTHKDNTYYIKRNPKYLRPKKNKTGETLQEEDAMLQIEGQEPILGKRDVNAKIINLLGINHEQFKQISMIAQGEFVKLLFATAEEKVSIFRNIFNTGIYRQFEKELKYKVIELHKKREEQKFKMMENMNFIYANNNEELLAAINAKDVHIENTLELLSKQIEENKNDEKELENINTFLEKEITRYILEKEKAKNINGLIKECETVKETVDQLEAEKEGINTKKERLERANKAKEVYIYEKTYDNTKQIYEKEIEQESIICNEINNLEISLKTAYETFNKLPQLNEELNSTKLIIDKYITIYLPAINNLFELKKEYKITDDLLKTNQIIQKQNEKQKKTLESQKQNLILELEKYDGIEDKIHQNKIDLLEKESKLTLLKELKEEVISYLNEEEKLKKLQKNYIKEFQKSEEKKHIYEEKERVFKLAQAGILAKDLKTLKPCPVCGSTNHPSPAKLREEVPLEKEVEDLKKAFEKANQHANETQTEVKSQVGYINGIKESIVKKVSIAKTYMINYNGYNYADSINDTDNIYSCSVNKYNTNKDSDKIEDEEKINLELQKWLDKSHEYILNECNTLYMLKTKFEQENLLKEEQTIKLTDLNQEIIKLNNTGIEINQETEKLNINQNEISTKITMVTKTIPNEHKTIKQIEQFIKTEKHKEKKLQTIITKAEEEYNKIATELTGQKNRLTDIKKRIDIYNMEAETTNKKYEQILSKQGFTTKEEYKESIIEESKIQKINKEIIKFHERYKSETDRLKELQKKTKESQLIELSSFDQLINEQKKKKSENDKKLKQLNNSIKSNQQSYTAIKDKLKEIEKIEESYGVINELSKIANGEGKNAQMDFEVYVLAVYFDEIIKAANSRLGKMTNDRFKLKRAVEKSDGRKKAGLDIEVYDSYAGNNITRPVKTLSGGEAFKAALSLALGLSDVIQRYAGGIVIDTLFIDEGFGSLDSRSLEQAIDTLMDMSQDADRMIGIISHVNDLKEKIDNRIEVIHDHTGSYIEKII